jgi:hypothetical protein
MSTFFFSYFASPSPQFSLGFFLDVVSSEGIEDVTHAVASPECDSIAVTFLGCKSGFASEESPPAMLLELLE